MAQPPESTAVRRHAIGWGKKGMLIVPVTFEACDSRVSTETRQHPHGVPPWECVIIPGALT